MSLMSKISVDQNLFFSENFPGVLKHMMSEIRQKKVLVDPKMEHFERIYGHTATVICIMGNLNPQLEKKLLNSF